MVRSPHLCIHACFLSKTRPRAKVQAHFSKIIIEALTGKWEISFLCSLRGLTLPHFAWVPKLWIQITGSIKCGREDKVCPVEVVHLSPVLYLHIVPQKREYLSSRSRDQIPPGYSFTASAKRIIIYIILQPSAVRSRDFNSFRWTRNWLWALSTVHVLWPWAFSAQGRTLWPPCVILSWKEIVGSG